ncbi:endonuclease/exonuclease/phosphatase family protein [Pseudonocardia xishanensis]|uniref:Endonuclease/exonuclease/phosphatase domain-containing protein n=1 Tax=Pseudonocardia xishanensis TaxID=630995 RepID=A0ABP8RW90_9PSEU
MLQRPHRRSGLAGPVAALGAPWLWFLLRDHTGPVGDVVAILLPVLVVLGALALAWRRCALLADPADVTVLSETSFGAHRRLADGYRYSVFGGTGDVSVYSRFPLRVLEKAGRDLPGGRVRVEAPVPFTLYALHVPRPWITDRGYQVTPVEHHRIMVALAAQVAAEPGPVVLAGDLNTTDRGRDYRVMAGALTDAVRDTRQGPTQVTTWRPLLLRIDHVFVSRGWCGDDPLHLPLPGSDHDAVTATVGPCRWR